MWHVVRSMLMHARSMHLKGDERQVCALDDCSTLGGSPCVLHAGRGVQSVHGRTKWFNRWDRKAGRCVHLACAQHS
jgi:hypothetical protein